MRASSADRPWDFSHIYDLVDSLSNSPAGNDASKEDAQAPRREGPRNGEHKLEEFLRGQQVEEKDFAALDRSLGDFSRIYQYLGTPLSSPAPAVQPPEPAEVKRETPVISSKDDYASDGATYLKNLFSGVKNGQKDDQGSAEDTVTDNASDTSVVPASPTLTKSQRKKRNRRERKAKEAAEATKAATVSESEADTRILKKTPAAKASAHVRASTPTNKHNLRPRDSSGRATTNGESTPGDLSASVKTAVERLQAAKQSNASPKVAESDATPSKPPRRNANVARTTSHPQPSVQKVAPAATLNVTPAATLNATHNAPPTMPKSMRQSPSQNGTITQWPITPAQAQQATHFLPSTVQPPPNKATIPMLTPNNAVSLPQTAPRKQPRVIQPLVVRSGEDRNMALFLKLCGQFPSDRTYLINPMNLTTHNNNPRGIHVFVDASNIFIGFNDQLKRSRGIPPYVQVPSVELSFDALALLMERRRPVARRVLAGSTPHMAAFDKAKAVGYECCILDKVYKARELTERQIFFREQDRLMGRGRAKAPPANNVVTALGGLDGNGSGSETNTPQYAKPAMIEQGVDEILHLKILESVVDYQEPASIVLATGDAAQAEYSQGFMAQAERALVKGWTVELVSWSKNISTMYTRKAWMDAWGERFKIVYLDDYAEELLAM